MMGQGHASWRCLGGVFLSPSFLGINYPLLN